MRKNAEKALSIIIIFILGYTFFVFKNKKEQKTQDYSSISFQKKYKDLKYENYCNQEVKKLCDLLSQTLNIELSAEEGFAKINNKYIISLQKKNLNANIPLSIDFLKKLPNKFKFHYVLTQKNILQEIISIIKDGKLEAYILNKKNQYELITVTSGSKLKKIKKDMPQKAFNLLFHLRKRSLYKKEIRPYFN
ncbi:MAG: hypothetical protein N4A33_03395 [Bacteriovoracaceae bacterium]|nr:hypothetical protein [Bacteriovoracaceae bacterium]